MPLDRSLISGLPVFAGLDGRDLDAILAQARSPRFPKDTEVFGQGEEATFFFLLLPGHIRVVRTSPEGHQVIARYITEGELFGIAVAMGRTTYPASAIAAARIAHALLRIVSQSGRKTAEGIEIDFPVTRQDIAEMTGTTLHTVSRLLSAWEEQGIVRSARQKVTVTDPHALMLVSENRRKSPAA